MNKERFVEKAQSLKKEKIILRCTFTLMGLWLYSLSTTGAISLSHFVPSNLNEHKHGPWFLFPLLPALLLYAPFHPLFHLSTPLTSVPTGSDFQIRVQANSIPLPDRSNHFSRCECTMQIEHDKADRHCSPCFINTRKWPGSKKRDWAGVTDRGKSERRKWCVYICVGVQKRKQSRRQEGY